MLSPDRAGRVFESDEGRGMSGGLGTLRRIVYSLPFGLWLRAKVSAVIGRLARRVGVVEPARVVEVGPDPAIVSERQWAHRVVVTNLKDQVAELRGQLAGEASARMQAQRRRDEGDYVR